MIMAPAASFAESPTKSRREYGVDMDVAGERDVVGEKVAVGHCELTRATGAVEGTRLFARPA
jgi:hypothetical protein